MKTDTLEENKSLNISKQLFRNTIFGWFEMVILFVSGFIVPPLLLVSLGKEGYGLWLLIGQLTAYLPMLDLGVSSSVGRFVAKYNAKKDFESLSKIISSSIFLFLFSSVCTVIITLIIWPSFSKFFNLSPEYFNIGRWLILLTGLGTAIDFPLRIGGGILQGFHRFDLTTCIACDQCAKACPVDCIYIGKKRVEGGKGFRITGYAIDYSKCMFCALCVEPCPVDCIFMGATHDLSCYSRDGCIVDFSRLPLEVAWGRATLNPTAVAESKVITEPVHGGPNQ